MQVSEVMNKGVISVDVNDTIKKVAALMKEKDIGSVPVYEDQHPVGFVTDRDIVINCVADGRSLDEPVSQAMTEDVFFVTQDQDIQEATRLMKENQVSRILVVDEREQPVGMLSLQDLAQTNPGLGKEALNSIKQ